MDMTALSLFELMPDYSTATISSGAERDKVRE
jgi:hypothetical protein